MTAFAMTLNQRVEILAQAGEDELGQPSPTGWEVVARPWANVRNLSGAQAIKAGAVTPQVQTSIRMRFRRDVLAGMRVRDGDTLYAVQAVLPDQLRRQHVDLVCEVIP